jgi:outer membrane protein assembly factor BamD
MNISASKTTLALLIPLLAGLSLVAACHKKAPEITPELASSDEALYRLGEQYIKKDSEKAILYLRQVIDSFPKSFYAQRAKLLIADAYFQKNDESNMILAAAEYREFIRSYPYSPSAAYAQYQIAMTFYRKMLKPGRDPSKTVQALAEFKKVITDFPGSDQAREAQEKIKSCEERLAGHSFEIAYGYYRRRAFRAAISRLTEVMSLYPNYTSLDRVYYTLGDCYFLMNVLDQAVPYFSKVVTDYPGRNVAESASKRLAEIEKLKKTPPSPKPQSQPKNQPKKK